ncbi:MAG: hypothetical protein NTU80_08200 [Verrucomicrobia bacterium]|nr:hypothetical protein [Verrucomicrobiota bacterium]
MPTAHVWNFFRIGGFDQVALTSAADLENLCNLDQKLWAALSCPVKGLEIDEKTLALLDTDKDGRIRAPELLAAIAWAKPYFKDLGILLSGRDQISLDAFADTAEGRAALASAKRILASLGKTDVSAISLADASDTAKLFAATKLNGDGVITPASSADPAITALIMDILATQGGTPDRSTVAGIDAARVETFFAAVSAHLVWADQAGAPEVLTLGAATPTATAAVAAVRTKVDDYFARTRLAAFDSRALGAVNRAETDYLVFAARDMTITADEIAGFPLARIIPDQPLALLHGINPAWAARIATLHQAAVTPVFGAATTSLTESQWTALKAGTDAYAAHFAAKAGVTVEKLGLPRLRELKAGAAPLSAALAALIAEDLALAPEFESIASVEKLLRYSRDFRPLLHNYVNFFDFYSPEYLAAFQAGTLYLDSRSTEFCIEVAGPSPLAAMSKAYIAYCDIKRPGCAPRKIAACLTNGDSDYLFVGRNGVFYDRQGRDWDATVSAIVDNPISIRQAFFSPYKKFIRMVEEQAAKRAAAAEAESNARLASAAEKTANADKAPPAPPKKFDVGVVAALGVAAGALGTIVGGFISGFLGLGVWMPAGMLGIILVISGPSMAIAWLKLRQRTIGPILEANGWAINGRVKINIPFGTKLTARARLPKGSKLDLNDPYVDREAARKRRVWTYGVLLGLLVLAAGAAWYAKVWPFAVVG